MRLPPFPSLVPAPGPAPVPEPTPSSTATFREAVEDAPCGMQDPTFCGVLHRVTGDRDLAQQLAPVLGVAAFVVVVLVVAVLLRAVLHRIIGRAVDRIEVGETDRRRGRLDHHVPQDPIAAERRVQRAKAIGSILHAVVSIVVWTAAVFVILPEIGVNITGLVAGAGIVGIALGFGAQTLVQDFVSGLFMIAEDQYGVGDVIDMGEATGVVEAVGLRVTRLRAVDGTVWHIRNGEVVRVGNMSQGWSRAVLDVGVAYGEDVTRVMELLKAVGLEMRADLDFADMFLDDPEVWGVEALAADQVTVRMIIKTVPLQQWVVAREMRRRIKHAFDSLGIEIPFPQRTVWIRAEGPDGSGPEAGGTARSRPEDRSRPDGEDDDGATRPLVPLSPVDHTRGEADVAHQDTPAPGTGEPFSASQDRSPTPHR